jgi:hypothetical protein
MAFMEVKMNIFRKLLLISFSLFMNFVPLVSMGQEKNTKIFIFPYAITESDTVVLVGAEKLSPTLSPFTCIVPFDKVLYFVDLKSEATQALLKQAQTMFANHKYGLMLISAIKEGCSNFLGTINPNFFKTMGNEFYYIDSTGSIAVFFIQVSGIDSSILNEYSGLVSDNKKEIFKWISLNDFSSQSILSNLSDQDLKDAIKNSEFKDLILKIEESVAKQKEQFAKFEEEYQVQLAKDKQWLRDEKQKEDQIKASNELKDEKIGCKSDEVEEINHKQEKQKMLGEEQKRNDDLLRQKWQAEQAQRKDVDEKK